MSPGFPQGDPGGGCLSDASQQYSQVQPEAKTINFFGRFSKAINAQTEWYTELNLYKNKSDSLGHAVRRPRFHRLPRRLRSTTPACHSVPRTRTIRTSARQRACATWPPTWAPAPATIDGDFTRFVTGLKGTWGAWDYDTALPLLREQGVQHARRLPAARCRLRLAEPHGRQRGCGHDEPGLRRAAGRHASGASARTPA